MFSLCADWDWRQNTTTAVDDNRKSEGRNRAESEIASVIKERVPKSTNPEINFFLRNEKKNEYRYFSREQKGELIPFFSGIKTYNIIIPKFSKKKKSNKL